MIDLKRYFSEIAVGGVGQSVVLSIALLASPAIAQQSNGSSIDPDADGLLRDLGAYIDEADSFTVEVQIEVDEISPRGQKIQYTSNIDLAVRGNDRLHTYEVGDLRNRTLWFNGDTFTVLDRDLGHYVVVAGCLTQVPQMAEIRNVVSRVSGDVSGSQGGRYPQQYR